MNLEKFRKLVGSSKGVLAYFALDKNGRSLTQHKGPLAESVKQADLATWVLNYFHAIDTYYPESRTSLLRFENLVLYLRRDGPNQFAVVLNHESNLAEFDAAFSQLCTQGNTSLPAKTAESAGTPSRKGETMLLRISDSSPTAAPQPVSSTAGLKGSKAPESKAKKGPPTGLILGAVALVAALVVVAILLLGPGESEPAGAPATAQPVTQPPAPEPEPEEPQATPQERAETLRTQTGEVAELARGNRNAAGAEQYVAAGTLQRAADAEFKAGNYEAAAQQYLEALELYGRSLMASLDADVDEALREHRLLQLFENRPEFVPQVRLARNTAASQAEAQEYAEAVETLEDLVERIPEIREDVVATLLTMGKEAAETAAQGSDPDDLEPALAIYRRLVMVAPENQEALAFLFRNAFDAGETITNAVGMELAYIPPGRFEMGSDPDEDPWAEPDETPHPVTLTRGYFMGVHEVTQEQWQEVMNQPIRMEDPNPTFLGNDLPVHSITYAQAVEFCRRLSEQTGESYRLPTEAEWEYAARAGTTTPFSIGSGTELGFQQANIFNPTIAEPRPQPVGTSGPPNRWGLYDVHGNVREWTATWRAPYPDRAVTDPQGPADEAMQDGVLAAKIVRGGDFLEDFQLSRSANRLQESPVLGNPRLGFRVVLEISSFAE